MNDGTGRSPFGSPVLSFDWFDAMYCVNNCSIVLVTFCLQASGVNVPDCVVEVFNEMKVRKTATQDDVKKRKKAVFFCLNGDCSEIQVEDEKQILVGDIGESVDDPYLTFIDMLPPSDCRYALYDASYETKETKKEELVFIFW